MVHEKIGYDKTKTKVIYNGYDLTLSFGIPVVSFDCDTGPKEILNGTGALLVKPDNTDALATSLIEFINDEQSRKNISIKSKEKALRYQIGEIIKNWEQLVVKL